MIKKGMPWPPDRKRAEMIDTYEKLYGTDFLGISEIHKSLHARVSSEGRDVLNYLELSFPKMIVDTPVSLMASSPPIISYSDPDLNETLQQILERSEMDATLPEILREQGVSGDGVALVVRDPDGGVRITPRKGRHYWAKTDPHDCDIVLSQSLLWRIEDGIGYQEEYTAGEVVRRRFQLSDSNASVASDGVEEFRVSTGINHPTLIHFPHSKSCGEHYGNSEYSGKIYQIFNRINERISSINRILDKHEEPKMGGPRLLLDQNGNLKNAQYFESDSGAIPQYITWNAELESSYKMLDRLIDTLFALTRVSKVFAMAPDGARYDSQPAFRLQMAQTLAKIREWQIRAEYRIKKMIRVAMAMALGIADVSEIPNPNVKWRDGLPKDVGMDAQTESVRVSSGTTSRVDAIRRLDDCDEAAALQTLAEIAREAEGWTVEDPDPPMDQEPLEDQSSTPQNQPDTILLAVNERMRQNTNGR